MFLGRDIYFNGPLNAICSEEKNILIGHNCLISFGVWIRTADPHLIYDAETLSRINPSLSVLIGQSVWIGQQVMILKGAEIGSGSIIGARSVVPKKKVGNNECWGGNPASKIKSNIFWSGECVHNYTAKKTLESNKFHKTQTVPKFIEDKTIMTFKCLDKISAGEIQAKFELLKSFGDHNSFPNNSLSNDKHKKSFAIRLKEFFQNHLI